LCYNTSEGKKFLAMVFTIARGLFILSTPQLKTITIPFSGSYVVVADVNYDDVECIIEQCEGELSEVSHPGGRPSKYKQINLDQVEKLAERGWTEESIADFFHICRATLSVYKNEYPEFMDAVKRGKDKAVSRVEMSQYEAAIGYSHPEEKIFCHKGQVIRVQTVKHYPPDVTAGIFILCNRKKDDWQHVQKIAMSDDSEDKLMQLVSAMNNAAKAVKKTENE